MKKLISTIMLTASSLMLFAQLQISVPRAVGEAFKTTHMTHDFVTWEMEGPNYRANSTDAQQMHHITVYDANGNLIRSESEVAASAIPEPIVNYYNEKYPTNTKYSVWLVETKDGKRAYYSNYNNELKRFDNQGKVMEEVKYKETINSSF